MTITVQDCVTYPLKSASGISISGDFRITGKGPEHDREWMLVHDDHQKAGQFISQRDRNCAKLATVKAFPYNSTSEFYLPGKGTLRIDHQKLFPSQYQVSLWNDVCDALDAGDEAAKAFSDFLDRPCRLVKTPDQLSRSVDRYYAGEGHYTGFADGFPLLITNSSSLKALSHYLPEGTDIDMSRFRPNIVLDDAVPFDEDGMNVIRIGNVELQLVKPCGRCGIPSIDQANGEQPVKGEPLRTLFQYRAGCLDGKKAAFFGQNAIVLKPGTIQQGNPV